MVVNRHATPANASTDAADRDAEMAPDDNNDKPLLPTSAAPSFEKKKSLLSMEVVLVLFYGAMNLGSASGIVLVNKAVFHTCGFHFPIALTCMHTLATALTMRIFALPSVGFFKPERIPVSRTWTLALAFCGYVIFGNWSLDVNSVGFYQLMKIMVAPTVVVMQYIIHGTTVSHRTKLSVAVLCVGVAAASVVDISVTIYGTIVAVMMVLVTSLYQIWAGSKQKELKASSMQLLHEYTPVAFLMMLTFIPLCEKSGLGDILQGRPPPPDSVLGFPQTKFSIGMILFSCVLGVLVSLSTFLFIGATSSLTYNVVGHVKTVAILTGGVVLYGDPLNIKKAFGLALAMGGIIWYTNIKMEEKKAQDSNQASK